MDKTTDFTPGIEMIYEDFVKLLTAAAKGVKVCLTAKPDNYFESNGDGTWVSAKTGEVVTAETLANNFRGLPEITWRIYS